MIVLIGFIATSIIDSSSLLNTGVVTFPIDLRILWEIQNPFHRLPGRMSAEAMSCSNQFQST